jgi:hypothetical protein
LTCLNLGCRKGGRECSYPDKEASQKTVRSGSKSDKSSADGTSSPEDHAGDANEQLPTIHDDEEEDYDDMDDTSRDSSYTPSSTLDQGTSPSTEASSTVPPTVRPPGSRRSSAPASKIVTASRAPSAPRDVQFYLNHFKEHITIHHYSLKRDSHKFLKGDFLKYTLKYEPLKYAVAGYAAYFYTISQPDGRMSTFLQFYNESVSRLRLSITKDKKQGLATLLTILQLASIEVRMPYCFVSVNPDTANRRCSVTG